MNGQRVVEFLVKTFATVKISRTGRKELVQRSLLNMSKYYELIFSSQATIFCLKLRMSEVYRASEIYLLSLK